jgi:hypothetical protein
MTDQPLRDREDAEPADEQADPEVEDTDEAEESDSEPGD